MKRFKTPFLILTLILTMPLVQACLDDDEDYYLAIATLRTTADDKSFFTLDDGETMYPQYPIGKFEDGQRVYVYFDILDEKVSGYDYNIDVKGLEEILTKERFVMTEEDADSIGDYNINITNIWFGDDYLNIKFLFRGTRNPSKLHMVNLVYNETETADENEEEAGYINLEFRHNAYDDYEAELLNGIVSFKGPFKEENMKGVKIRYKSIYEGIKYVKVDFETKEKNGKSFSSETNTITGTSIAY